jgi:hypothetical protein
MNWLRLIQWFRRIAISLTLSPSVNSVLRFLLLRCEGLLSPSFPDSLHKSMPLTYNEAA